MAFNYAPSSVPPYSNNTQMAEALPPVQPVEPKKVKVEWPASVRNYVARSLEPTFASAHITKEEIESCLKNTIRHATESGTLLTTDWDNMPLPQKLIQDQRQRDWQQQSISNFVANNNLPPPFLASASRKRKSTDHTDPIPPPWQANIHNSIEGRVTKPIPSQNAMMAESPLGKNNGKFQKAIEKRQKRFDGGYASRYRSPTPEFGNGPVVGRCEVLEKRYLRLTAAPNPDLVRPLHILRQTLELLKKKWRKEQNYSYICDQFKSLRQDLTVQHIHNEFTVEVYEIHARIALEKGDLGEYNQCQTQLRALHAQNLGGHPVEFKAYRILYFIHTANRTSLNDVMAELTPAEKNSDAIKHALGVRSALALGNYHKFFRLYLETPYMGAYLMDMFVTRERLAALANMCKAYKPSVPLRFITEELGFESDQDAAEFIIQQKGEDLLEQKDDSISFLTGKGLAIFETARKSAFSKVDLKGQI